MKFDSVIKSVLITKGGATMSNDRERHLNVITVNVKAQSNKKEDPLLFVWLNAAFKTLLYTCMYV